jgi:CheY-like chemotaxis protein
MPIGGTLRVSARLPRPGETFGFGVVHAPEAFAQICVTDTGTGMSPHVKEHAFDPLFTTKQNGGTGLGLAVAHQIATRHSGSIFAESEVGVGTTFHVFLPLTEVLVSAPVPAAETARIRARRVLLVEDEQDIATGLGELLSDYGVETAVASTGEMAEPVARRFRPDVVLVDIGLPDIDGFEVGRRLRASWPLLRIVFISGHGDARRVPGVDPNMAFLQKPFTIEAVLATIADLESRSNS